MKTKERVFYGAGALGKDLVYGFVAGYILFFLNDIMGIDALFLGTLFLFARAFDAFNDPIMGMIVENTRSKFGKFRPWILIGTILNASVIVLLFTVPDLSPQMLKLYVSALYILWGITYTLMDIPYWSMIPALSIDQKERENTAVVARVCAGIGFTLITVGTVPLVKLLGAGNDQKGYSLVAIGISVIFVLLIGLMVNNVKEHISVEQEKLTIKGLFHLLIQNDQLLVVMITVVCFNISMYITTTLGIYFFKYDVKNEVLYSVFAGVAGIAQILAMLSFPLLSRFLTRKKIFGLSVIASTMGYLGLYLAGQLGFFSIPFLFGSGFFIFVGLGLMNILTTAMLADTVEYGEWKLGIRSESVVFSVQTFVVKSASALSAFIVGIGLNVINFQRDQVQTLSTLNGLRFLMFLLPIFGLMASLFVYMKMYKIDSAFYARIVSEIKLKNNLEEV
ncbi:glycoside-pentoside-hexuronide (GPH):cation symporter [Fusibacter bizertensis]|uniref:Glycoside-pentoside-hexuronide (GPH):cation symporter n=1 Tax=Fusibacter bizertensis TaxID=1488331 RepID=A0ABT6NBD2_9FIRM|nr:glycoside-pentoside-hexuronide (GPH):cation symporter [Fusibacter bizertensis]MDH8677727.1 glycoside-pentoside-hexuronide (GPH):cation symporter [Fusibacter bizertensis]